MHVNEVDQRPVIQKLHPFKCPKCRGSHFGTIDVTATPVIRQCHDEFGTRCKWRGTWEEMVEQNEETNWQP